MYILHKTFFQKQKSPHVSNVYTQNKLVVLAPCSHFSVFFSCMKLAASFVRFCHFVLYSHAQKLQVESMEVAASFPSAASFCKTFCVLCEFPEWTFGCLLQMKAFSALICYKLYDPTLSSGFTSNRRWTSHMQMLPSSHTYHNIVQSHHPSNCINKTHYLWWLHWCKERKIPIMNYNINQTHHLYPIT